MSILALTIKLSIQYDQINKIDELGREKDLQRRQRRHGSLSRAFQESFDPRRCFLSILH